MSEQYEAVVFSSDEITARQTCASLSSELRLRLVRLAQNVFGIYRVAGRDDAMNHAANEAVAMAVSSQVGQAVALFYDNSCGIRSGIGYIDGLRRREFGDGDAWWVPYGDDGEPLTNGRRFRVSELLPDIEYECIFSAIDAALAVVQAGSQVTEVLVKQAFCYEVLQSLAEYPPIR